MNHSQNHSQNHSHGYFNNNVKFTGSAVEFPGDAMTALLYLVMLLMILARMTDVH